jgi:AbrB family looped-hinge helix DNA binding protein
MRTVIVSSKFQVVIPKEIRESIDLRAGTKLEIISYGSRIELVPIHPMKKLKGMFKGISTGIIREDDRKDRRVGRAFDHAL